MKNSTYILIHKILKGIADSCIKIFIPLLILRDSGSLNLTFLYLIIAYGLTAILFFALKKFIQKFKLLSIIFHIIPIITANLLLVLPLNIWVIIILAVLNAVSTTLYYGATNLMFIYLDKNPNTAKFESGLIVGKIIFTLFSAYLLGTLVESQIFVIIFSLVMYVASVIPILVGYKSINANMGQSPKLSFKEVVKDNTLFLFLHFLIGFTSLLVDCFMPIYLYQNGISFTLVGVLLALQNLVSLLGIYFAQFMINKKQNLLLIIINLVLCLFGLTTILLSKEPIVLYIATFCLALGHQLFHIFKFTKFSIDQKNKGYFYDSIFYRDVAQNTGRALVASLCLLSIAWIPIGLGYFASLTMAGFFIGNKRFK